MGKKIDNILQMKEIEFRRCVVLDDVETIKISDASPQMACSAINIGFKRRSGLYN